MSPPKPVHGWADSAPPKGSHTIQLKPRRARRSVMDPLPAVPAFRHSPRSWAIPSAVDAVHDRVREASPLRHALAWCCTSCAVPPRRRSGAAPATSFRRRRLVYAAAIVGGYFAELIGTTLDPAARCSWGVPLPEYHPSETGSACWPPYVGTPVQPIISNGPSSTHRQTRAATSGFTIFYMGINMGAFIAPTAGCLSDKALGGCLPSTRWSSSPRAVL